MFINNISWGEGYLLRLIIFMRLSADCIQWINLTSSVVTFHVKGFIAVCFVPSDVAFKRVLISP